MTQSPETFNCVGTKWLLHVSLLISYDFWTKSCQPHLELNSISQGNCSEDIHVVSHFIVALFELFLLIQCFFASFSESLFKIIRNTSVDKLLVGLDVVGNRFGSLPGNWWSANLSHYKLMPSFKLSILLDLFVTTAEPILKPKNAKSLKE